jgi:peptide deformylase
MAIRKIAQIGHPVLRQVARTLTREELATPAIQSFIDDLVDTMHDADGAGLAAIQVYEPIAICAIEVRNNPRYPYKPPIPLTILVNPVLTPVPSADGDADQFDNYEGCLSVPNLRGLVKRDVHVRVQAWDRHGTAIDEVVHGLKAGTYQHEVDHLLGKLFVDRVTDPSTFTTWTEFERHHKAAFVEGVQKLVARVGS